MELTRQNIPFQITSGVQFFEQAHIKDLVAQVKFAYNPRDSRAFHRFACLLPKIGSVTAERIFQAALAKSVKSGGHVALMLNSRPVRAKVPKAARLHWDSLTTTLEGIVEAAQDKPPSQVVSLAAEGWYSDFIKTLYPNYRQRMDDLQSLVGFAGRFSDLQELLSQIVLLNSETSQNSVYTEEDKLRLTTVHQAKGLEFPVVFLLAASDGLFPLSRAMENNGLDEETTAVLRGRHPGHGRTLFDLSPPHPVWNKHQNLATQPLHPGPGPHPLRDGPFSQIPLLVISPRSHS